MPSWPCGPARPRPGASRWTSCASRRRACRCAAAAAPISPPTPWRARRRWTSPTWPASPAWPATHSRHRRAAARRLGRRARPDLRLGLDGTDLAATDVAVQRFGPRSTLPSRHPWARARWACGPTARPRPPASPSTAASWARTAASPWSSTASCRRRRGHGAQARAALLPVRAGRAGPASIATGSPAPPVSMRRSPTSPPLPRTSRSRRGAVTGGAFRLGADHHRRGAGGTDRGHARRRRQRPGGLPPGVQELVGPAPTLQARAVVEPDRPPRSRAWSSRARRAAEGEPATAFADQSLGGELRLSVPDLAGWSRWSASRSRAARVARRFRRDRAAPGGHPRRRVDGLTVGRAGVRPGRARRRREGPSRCARRLGPAGGDARGGRSSPWRRATSLRASSLRCRASSSTRRAPTSRAMLRSTSTRRSRVAGCGRGPRPRSAGALDRATGRRQGGARLAAHHARGPPGRDPRRRRERDRRRLRCAASARLDATVADALGRGAVDARLRARSFAAPDLAVERATVAVGGPLAALDVTASANGSQGGRPFDVSRRRRARRARPAQDGPVTDLPGAIAGEHVRLAQPATVVLDGRARRRRPARPGPGPARVQGSLELGDPRVRGQLASSSCRWRPAAFRRAAARRQRRARLDLAARRTRPQLTLDVGRRGGARTPRAVKRPTPRSTATLQGGRLEADLTVDRPGRRAGHGPRCLPVRLGLDPPAFALDQAAAPRAV